MSLPTRTSLLILFIGWGWSFGQSDTAGDLEQDLGEYFLQDFPRLQLVERLRAREEELKPLLQNHMDLIRPHLLGVHEFDIYISIEKAAYLTVGLEDKEFSASIWRQAMEMCSDHPRFLEEFFSEYAKNDREGAEDTFKKLLITGNDNVREEASKQLRIIEKKKANGRWITNDPPSHTTPASSNGTQDRGELPGSDFPIAAIVLGIIGALGISGLWLRVYLRRS